MAKNKEEKTNVMRTLDQKKIPYTAHSYDPDGPIDGVSVAQTLGQPPEQVFKTLVTKAASGAYYVFDIPVAENLDLKKAAKAVGEKSVAMLPQKELLPLHRPQKARRCSGPSSPSFSTAFPLQSQAHADIRHVPNTAPQYPVQKENRNTLH